MARRQSSILLAVCSAASLFGTAAPAAAGGYYKAEPATLPPAERLVVRDLVWKCGPGGCVSGKSHSRAAVDCAALVRQIGEVRSFSIEGRAIPADELQKCNARAR